MSKMFNFSLVLAGHETTATLITWALYNLVTNPDVYQQCQDEVDSVLGENKELTVRTLSLLIYTEAVLKETLRHHQPVPVLLRTATADNIIVASDGKQIRIRKGVDIVMNLNIMNR
ncbi:MAG: cytochrome P450 [Bacteroidia bacterium]|nr:cytochrome P450 [Bacteroidia bacterium]